MTQNCADNYDSEQMGKTRRISLRRRIVCIARLDFLQCGQCNEKFLLVLLFEIQFRQRTFFLIGWLNIFGWMNINRKRKNTLRLIGKKLKRFSVNLPCFGDRIAGGSVAPVLVRSAHARRNRPNHEKYFWDDWIQLFSFHCRKSCLSIDTGNDLTVEEH